MPILKVDKELNSQMYFITFTVQRWYYLFDRCNRWQILADSIKYCQKTKGLKIYAYVFMLNHIHIMFQSPDVSGFIRDFKRHTTKELLKNIRKTEPNLIELFFNKDGQHEIWQKSNKPKLIETDYFSNQKFNYIHNNPVKKQYVKYPEHWMWSSAGYYKTEEQGYIKITHL